MQSSTPFNLENEVELASQERDDALLGIEDEEERLAEDVEDSKRDFEYIMSEVKEATQEAISQRTLRDYRG
jgi:hypothetical protein